MAGAQAVPARHAGAASGGGTDEKRRGCGRPDRGVKWGYRAADADVTTATGVGPDVGALAVPPHAMYIVHSIYSHPYSHGPQSPLTKADAAKRTYLTSWLTSRKETMKMLLPGLNSST